MIVSISLNDSCPGRFRRCSPLLQAAVRGQAERVYQLVVFAHLVHFRQAEPAVPAQMNRHVELLCTQRQHDAEHIVLSP